MAKRHQARRRRAYGPRQHELNERRSRRRGEDLERWFAVAGDAWKGGLAPIGDAFGLPVWAVGHEAVGARLAD